MATTETTQEVTTTEQAQPPAERKELPAISALPAKFEDGSVILDKKKAGAIFDKFEELATQFDTGARAVKGATAAICEMSYDLRAICTRPDGITPDWAGQFNAYAQTFDERITDVLIRIGMSKDERTGFRNAVRRYDSDNEYRKLYQARYLASKDSKAVGMTAAEIVPGVKVTSEMSKALVKLAEGQTVTKSDGTTAFAPGYTEPQTYAQADQPIGVKKSQRSAVAPPAKSTPTVAWSQIRADVVKRNEEGTEKGKLHVSPLATAEELHRLCSVFAIGLVGAPGDKVPAVDQRAKVIGAIESTRDTLNGLLAVLVDKKDKAEVLAPTLWTEQ